MDAKNLAVLRQLRDSMQKQEPPDPSGTPTAVAWLKVLVQSLREAPKKKKPKSKKQKSTAAKATPTTHKKKREEIRQVARTREMILADKALAAKYRDCRECGRPVHVGENIPLSPVRCGRCRGRDGQIDLGIKSRSGNDFSEITVLPGGAPGLGKRK
ncbi:hypothetical protein [Pseudomonas capsici]|uniref:hypothetical protein n=1 Tax=Pseudomonas capsici TaxID=2810614 RepID=UPI0021F0FA45|nr:hypothetical protein [Pseudomonas capsici]MCV4343285.1 hypothetical protein [Pseudomonas capsici]